MADRVQALEERIAASIPRTEFETVRSNLELEINDIQTRLYDSAPRSDVEYVKRELQKISDAQARTTSLPTEHTEELQNRLLNLEILVRSISAKGTEVEKTSDEMQPREQPSIDSSLTDVGTNGEGEELSTFPADSGESEAISENAGGTESSQDSEESELEEDVDDSEDANIRESGVRLERSTTE